MRVVVALGGNALLKRGEPLTATNQRRNIAEAALVLAALVNDGHELVITHGNGPQVGLLALQGAAYKPDEAYPLDILGAETEGMIGYLIEQEVENALEHSRAVATLLTQIVVDPKDSAFSRPTKFVGPIYGSEREARNIAKDRGWSVARDGNSWRRVVASPQPVEIPDLKILQILLDNDVVVICAGGGGIPVIRRNDGSLLGVEAVIDKDHASKLLADQIEADALLLLTDMDGVYRDFGTDSARKIELLTEDQLAALDLPEGSMAPKVSAAMEFTRNSDRFAAIGALKDARRILSGSAGTRVSA
ncbi:carbamate kinase [Gymnodinialimonas sp. 2305UL16-5]|uniref:carbamate kinase n=1 Tax=Gymnodinialimonas mytili TaxID=3126503 RepID=UPI0030ABE734